MNGPHDPKHKKKESMSERLQHDENAWVAAEKAFNEQFAQLFGYVQRLEQRVTSLESTNKVLKHQIRALLGVKNAKNSKDRK